MQASSILQEAINRMQSHIMAACGTQEGGLAASLVAGMLNGSQDKITGELQIFFDTKVQGSKDREAAKRNAKDARDERAKLHNLAKVVAARGHSIGIGVEATSGARQQGALKKLLQQKVNALRALKRMSSESPDC